MKAEIKGMHSPDVEDLENYVSEDSYGILIQILLGPKDKEGSESFNVTVCSAQYLQETYEEDIVNLRHTILMNKFSYTKFKSFVEKTFCTPEADNWYELAPKLSQYGYWEFEDHQE